ncbi:xylosidase/arabinosidase [Plectosphaerella plurivora]|uniref:Xylosidase/arabinosidase n=1 Tax=Plectosphaerella plurivora TaxID=936078 RepID=A0A9P9ABI1_9PEZI|nr:xylosidase/arabinosidase [Plectosphaerella plurivora]
MAMTADLETYHNPIVPGFAPDPAVIQVNGTYYCVNSSFHVFPGLPIYASQDLKEWVHIGNAFNRRSQIELRGARTNIVDLKSNGTSMVASMGIVAPSIHYHDGVFYIATSKMQLLDGKFGWRSFVISTTDVYGDNWSDPVFFDWNGIDVSLFFEDDKVFVQGSWCLDLSKQPSSTIYQGEVDLATGNWIQEPREIWPGWLKHDTEGPHMYKVGGLYYLIAAEGGTFENHVLSVARSESVWGPFESWDQNPIATSRGTDEYIQNVGHGALFQDPAGRWWAAVLGVRKLENGVFGLGRETFLSPVDWPEGGWPMVRQPKMSFTRERVASSASLQALSSPPKHVEDLYLQDHDKSRYTYHSDGSTLTLRPSRTTLADPVETCTFLGRRQRALSSTATATLDLSPAAGSQVPTGKGITVGLAWYKDPMRFVSIAHDFDTNAAVLTIRNEATGMSGTLTRPWKDSPVRVDLRIVARPLRYTFEARGVFAASSGAAGSGGNDQTEWAEIGSFSSTMLAARDYTGPLFGVFALAGVDGGEEAEVCLREFCVVNDVEGETEP